MVGVRGGGGGENPEYPEKTPDSQPEDQYIIIITGEKPLIVRIGSVWSEIAGFNQVSYRQIHLSLQTCWTVRLLPRGHVSLFSPLTYIVVISLWLPSTCFLTSTDKHLADRVCSATGVVSASLPHVSTSISQHQYIVSGLYLLFLKAVTARIVSILATGSLCRQLLLLLLAAAAVVAVVVVTFCLQ